MELLLSLAVGIALSACSGFRVFVPMLVANLATRFDLLHFSGGFEWLTSPMATYILLGATVIEIMAYYVPVVDNFLDMIATPASVAAGSILTTSFLKIDSPELQWGLGILAVGGVAGTIQTGTGLLRLASTKFTGGFGNGFLASLENFLSVSLSILTIWLPVFVAFLGIILFLYLVKKIYQKFFSHDVPKNK
jgi:Domain of unknown function (DUF4126)